MSEEEMLWYESKEGMKQYIESISSPRLLAMKKHFETIKEITVSELYLVEMAGGIFWTGLSMKLNGA